MTRVWAERRRQRIRKQEWQVGYGVIGDYPVLGVGPGMARFYFPRYHPQFRSQLGTMDMEINNLYLNVTAETGTLGLLAFCWMALAGMGGLLEALWRGGGLARLPALTALFASLVGCAAQFMGSNTLFLVYFTALIGLACAGARVAATGMEQQTAGAVPANSGKRAAEGRMSASTHL